VSPSASALADRPLFFCSTHSQITCWAVSKSDDPQNVVSASGDMPVRWPRLGNLVQKGFTMQFGFLPKPLDVSDSDISVRSTADGRAILAEFESDGRVSDGWHEMLVDRYELPSTHKIEVHGSQDDDELKFLILVLGFLHGLRLLPEGWVHLHPASVKTGRFNNFILKESEILPCLMLASNFYRENRQTRNVKRLLSAITLSHWGQTQSLQFDEFNYLYMAIDACWKIFRAIHPAAVQRSGHIKHPQRPRIMCHILGLSLPTVFDPSSAINV
jgi:hypothetical protein